jgi:hypothetical protein
MQRLLETINSINKLESALRESEDNRKKLESDIKTIQAETSKLFSEKAKEAIERDANELSLLMQRAIKSGDFFIEPNERGEQVVTLQLQYQRPMLESPDSTEKLSGKSKPE